MPRMSVNLSMRQIEREGLVAEVASLLAEWAIAPPSLNWKSPNRFSCARPTPPSASSGPAPARRLSGGGRLRHGLFVPRLPAAIARAPAQDRQLLRPRHRPRPQRQKPSPGPSSRSPTALPSMWLPRRRAPGPGRFPAAGGLRRSPGASHARPLAAAEIPGPVGLNRPPRKSHPPPRRRGD